ncbi:MAG: class I SAM-dependent methyltransferase [Pseudomonadota bacterium]
MESPGPATTPWSRERIEELLRSESFDYQAIPLPHGLNTGTGHDRSGTAEVILPRDMSGQSFVDLGCSLGFFCFEAARRGASRSVGLDFASENVRRGRILAEVLGLPVEFRQFDIDHQPLTETFDHVICLNVLHHLANPILGLDRLIAATRRQLTLELATFGAHDRRKLGLGWLQEKLLSGSPSVMVSRGTAGEGVKQFYITQTAIENLLRFRRGCFASVKIAPSPFKERFLVIAHKRQIRNLMILGFPGIKAAGPVVKALHEGVHRNAAGFLGNLTGAATLDAGSYHEPRQAQDDRLIFDYDIMRPEISGAIAFEHDPALDVIGTAESRRAVTVWLPPEEMNKAIRAEMAALSGKARKKLSPLLDLSASTKQLIRHYRTWLEFLAKAQVENRMLTVEESGTRLLTREEWERDIVRPLLDRNP